MSNDLSFSFLQCHLHCLWYTNENRWSLFITRTRYSLLRIQTPEIIFYLLFKQFKFYTPAQNQGGALLACSFDIEPRFRILATRPFFLGTGKATIFLE